MGKYPFYWAGWLFIPPIPNSFVMGHVKILLVYWQYFTKMHGGRHGRQWIIVYYSLIYWLWYDTCVRVHAYHKKCIEIAINQNVLGVNLIAVSWINAKTTRLRIAPSQNNDEKYVWLWLASIPYISDTDKLMTIWIGICGTCAVYANVQIMHNFMYFLLLIICHIAAIFFSFFPSVYK